MGTPQNKAKGQVTENKEVKKAVPVPAKAPEKQSGLIADKKFLTAKEAADMLGIGWQTLAKWRKEKKVLPYIKIGNRIRYRRSDVEGIFDTMLVMPED